MKQEIKYVCEHCKSKYYLKSDAIKCEKHCVSRINEFYKIKGEFYLELNIEKEDKTPEETYVFLADKCNNLHFILCKIDCFTKSITDDMKEMISKLKDVSDIKEELGALVLKEVEKCHG